MNVSARIDIIDKIGRELQRRYGYDDIDTYLAGFNVEPPQQVSTNSKWVYVKQALRSVDVATLGRMLSDLGLGSVSSAAALRVPPANWEGEAGFRLFISHLAKDKDKASRLKSCLADHAISGFVAHEDIHPTLQWQTEIERALFTMDAMVAVHTAGFSASMYCQQEVGFALGRGVKIISLKMGEAPTGFISVRQALPRLRRTAEEIAAEIAALLAKDPLTAPTLQAAAEAAAQRNRALNDIPF